MSSGGKESASQSEIEAKLNQFEGRIDDLKHAYDMYFNGIDRRPPHLLQKEVTRQLRTLEHRLYIQSTAQKFRLRSLVQRYQTYKQYWDRIMRQIEEGTYVRDRVKAQRKNERMEQRAEQEEQGPLELDLDLDAIDDLNLFAQNISSQPPTPSPEPPQPQHPSSPPPAVASSAPLVDEDIRAQRIRELQAKLGIAQQAPPVPSYAPPAQPLSSAASEEEQRKAKLDAMRRRLEQRASRTTQPPTEQPPATPPSTPSGNYSREQLQQKLRARQSRAQAPPQSSSEDARVQQVYRNLVEAKRRCNEPTENLTYESVARSMAQQRERLKQTHNANDVDFKVVIKSGKAYLKPEPK